LSPLACFQTRRPCYLCMYLQRSSGYVKSERKRPMCEIEAELYTCYTTRKPKRPMFMLFSDHVQIKGDAVSKAKGSGTRKRSQNVQHIPPQPQPQPMYAAPQQANPMSQLKDVFGLMAQMKHVFSPPPASSPMSMAPPARQAIHQQPMVPMGYSFQQVQNVLPRLAPAQQQYSIPKGFSLVKNQ